MKGQKDRQEMKWFLVRFALPWEREALFGDKGISWQTMDDLAAACELLVGVHPDDWGKTEHGTRAR